MVASMAIVAIMTITNPWCGDVLTPETGRIQGPSGVETYYNLPTDYVVELMRNEGFGEEYYPHWVRSDGVNMLGGYVMVAVDTRIRPKGTILPTSLGIGIVVDCGDFMYEDETQIDISVRW